MKYEKAIRRAKVLNAICQNEKMIYEVRGSGEDAVVIQLYNDRPAGIAAY